MKKSVMIMVSMAVLLVASSPAWAGNYFTGKLGRYMPEEGGLDDGGYFEAAYGFDLSRATNIKNLALEVGLGYYTANGDGIAWDLDVLPVTASGIYTYHFHKSAFSVYGGAGLGLYYVMWDLGPADGDDLEFGAHALVGGRYAFNRDVEIGVELKVNEVGGDYDWGGKFINFALKFNF